MHMDERFIERDTVVFCAKCTREEMHNAGSVRLHAATSS